MKRSAVLTPTALAAAVAVAAAVAAEPQQPAVRIERVAGEPARGRLVAIAADAVRITADGVELSVPLAEVRMVVREGESGTAAVPAAVLVTTTDGGTLSGTDFVPVAESGVVTHAGGRVELPVARVRRVAWLAAGESRPAWLAELPERPTSDLVAVRREEGHALVECAILGVSAEGLSVVLDGETIPVKRAKLLGAVWLREPAEAGPVVVDVDGGRLTARTVRWSPAGLLLDDDVRLPADMLCGIDYAAGRTTPLADVPAEKTSFEPFFGALVEQPELAAFFAPRTVADPGATRAAALVVRPRTTITWRVPAGSRRFRGAFVRDVPPQTAAAVDVVVAVDGVAVFRRRLGGQGDDADDPVPIDLALEGGRRLTLTADFGAGGIGCGVRLVGGAFEK